jgi:E1A/CREB-binding protein
MFAHLPAMLQLQKCIDSDWRSRQEQQLDPAELESLGVEGLTVRVVNITNKVVEVKRKFADHLKGTGYPSHFPFKQKVILLFQRIEGVDVLLFIVYVQVCNTVDHACLTL